MANKYYEVVGKIDGKQEVLFGSFVRADCKYEMDAEKEGWKDDGYKGIKIVSRDTEDTPDPEVYEGEIVNKQQLFMQQAPSFNFELDADQLLAKALESGYVTKVEGVEDSYLINQEY